MRPLQVGIIEDEFLARETLKAFLERHCESVEVLFMAGDLESGVNAIRAHQPEAIFLDIEMPGHSGMEVRNLLGETTEPLIVFTTAYANYAVDAFGLEAVDYLLKPIDIVKLRRAVDRLRERTKKQAKLSDGSITIPTTNGQLLVKTDNILFLKADGSYTEVHTNAERHLVSRKLIEMEELLDPEQFLRVHRSYVVNVSKMIEFVRQANSSLKMENGTIIPVSRSNKELVRGLFQSN
ncbi:MAG: LytTR family DNA-binding domain-containing protein [Flavobacteriales bacterium]|nr:LytTR family DNA-binding domain-containing protein [Flavobacteriales bacterium]